MMGFEFNRKRFFLTTFLIFSSFLIYQSASADNAFPKLFIFNKERVVAAHKDEKKGKRLPRRSAAKLSQFYAGINENAVSNSNTIIFNLGKTEYEGRKISTDGLGENRFLSRYKLFLNKKPVGDATLSTLKNKKKIRIEGSASVKGLRYSISAYNGNARLAVIDPTLLEGSECGSDNNEVHTLSASVQSRALNVAASLSSENTNTIDLLVFYTDVARTQADIEYRGRVPGVLPIDAHIKKMVADLNYYMQNSRANARFNLLGSILLPKTQYNPEASKKLIRDQLSDIQNGSVPFIQQERERLGADLVMLISENESVEVENGVSRLIAGRAYIFSNTPDRDKYGYSVLARLGHRYGPDYLSMLFAHEIGHNLGGGHDKANGNGYHPFSNGYQFNGASGTLFRDIMAYPPGAWIPYFSNPDVIYDGKAAGSSEANNVRTFNEIDYVVAKYRASGPPVMNPANPVSRTVQTGAKVAFDCYAEGATGYIWIKDGQYVNSARSQQLLFNEVKLSDAGQYRCEAYNAFGNTLSNWAELVVVQAPIISKQPESITVQKGSAAKFTVVSPDGEKYEWTKNGSIIANSNSSSYIIPVAELSHAGTYSCWVYKSLSATKGGVASTKCNDVTLTVLNGVPVPTAVPTKTATPTRTYTPISTLRPTLTPTLTSTPTLTPTNTPAKLKTYFDAEPNDISASAGSLVVLACELYSMSKPLIQLERFNGSEWTLISSTDKRSLFYSHRVKLGKELVRCSAKDLSGVYADVTGRIATVEGKEPTPTPTPTSTPVLCGTKCWQNQADRFDVDANGIVNQRDFDVFTAFTNSKPASPLPAPSGGLRPPPYADVNGDGRATGLDGLLLANYLNSLK